MRAERAPRVRGVHEGLRVTLDVHVAHFCPMCLTGHCPEQPACATLRALLITPRTGPNEVQRAVLAGRVTRVDPGGAPARARRPRRLSEGSAPRALHAPARACTAGATSAGKGGASYPSCSKIEFF